MYRLFWSAFLALFVAAPAFAGVCSELSARYDLSVNACRDKGGSVEGEYAVSVIMSCRDVRGCLRHSDILVKYNCAGGVPFDVSQDGFAGVESKQDNILCQAATKDDATDAELDWITLSDDESSELDHEFEGFYARLKNTKLKKIELSARPASTDEEEEARAAKYALLGPVAGSSARPEDAAIFADLSLPQEGLNVQVSAPAAFERETTAVMTSEVDADGTKLPIFEYFSAGKKKITHAFGSIELSAAPGVELPPEPVSARMGRVAFVGLRVLAPSRAALDRLPGGTRFVERLARERLQKWIGRLPAAGLCEEGRFTPPFRVTLSWIESAPASGIASETYSLRCSSVPQGDEVPELRLVR